MLSESLASSFVKGEKRISSMLSVITYCNCTARCFLIFIDHSCKIRLLQRYRIVVEIVVKCFYNDFVQKEKAGPNVPLVNANEECDKEKVILSSTYLHLLQLGGEKRSK